MKDWKATVRTWERWRKENRQTEQRLRKTVSAQQYNQRDYTEEELDAVSAGLIAEAKAFKG